MGESSSGNDEGSEEQSLDLGLDQSELLHSEISKSSADSIPGSELEQSSSTGSSESAGGISGCLENMLPGTSKSSNNEFINSLRYKLLKKISRDSISFYLVKINGLDAKVFSNSDNMLGLIITYLLR